MKEQKDKIDYDKEVLDLGGIEGTDIKINPDFYIHSALIKAQAALLADNLNEGYTKYRNFIEHMEVLCKSSKILGEDYEKDLKKFTDSEEYKKEDKVMVKSVKLANKKLGLMMESVFQKKTATGPLEI